MSSLLIAVDVGNTTLSAAQFSWPVRTCGAHKVPAPHDVWQSSVAELDFKALARWAPAGPCRWIIGSVNDNIRQSLVAALQGYRDRDPWRVLEHKDFRLDSDVDAREQVGMDRLAAALAANALRNPVRPAIVIDTGTAVTIDVVSSDGVFRGGQIFPGMGLSLQALAQGTFRLPLLAPVESRVPCIGRNTHEAMQSGVFWATLGAINEIVHRLETKELQTRCDIVVTGGDIERLLPHLNFPVRHEPYLVLAGLAMTQREAG